MRHTATILLGLALLGTGCRGWVSEQPPVHLNPNMDTQEKLKPYRKSEFFPNGRAMQTPPDGTVARTYAGNEVRDRALLGTDEHYNTGKQGGAFASTIPAGVDLTLATLRRGQERYNIYCSPCHGKDGAGQGTVSRRLTTKPPTFHQQRIWDLVPGDIFNTITHGKNFPNMAPYAAQIPVEDRWAIVAYLRALMQTQKPDLPAFTGGTANDATAFDGDKSEDAAALDAKLGPVAQTVTFDDGTANLSDAGQAALNGVAAQLKGNTMLLQVTVVAADAALAQQRAAAIKTHLGGQGVDGGRVVTQADTGADSIDFRTADANE